MKTDYVPSQHSSKWPNYIPAIKDAKGERIAIYEHGQLFPRKGKPIPAFGHDELLNAIWDFNGMVFMDEFASVPFLPHMARIIQRDEGDVFCDNRARADSIKLRRGRSTRWIGLSRKWGLSCSDRFMDVLHDSFLHCGVGVAPTPGSLGELVMKYEWPLRSFGKPVNHSCLSSHASDFIAKHRTGGRVDTPGLGYWYEQLFLYDLASAYLAHWFPLPDGTAKLFKNGDCEQYWTYFAECEVTIRTQLPLGPLPSRTDDGKVEYPTVGTFTTYAFKEQVEWARTLPGCTVKVGFGYGWMHGTMDTQSGARKLYDLRTTAPDDFVQLIMKLATNHAIGHHGMNSKTQLIVVGEDKANVKLDRPICLGNIPLSFYAHEIPLRTRRNSMLHWNTYTMHMCALTLAKFAYPYAANGALVATNYDSVTVLDGSASDMYPHKKSLEEILVGTWRWNELTSVYINQPRSYKEHVKFDPSKMKRRAA